MSVVGRYAAVAVWMARSRTARGRSITPMLDVMQTLPSFTYLLPLSLFFGIGAAAAVICTLIYALPPVMRIAVARPAARPRADARGDRRRWGRPSWQRLPKVELPMAKRTIIVGHQPDHDGGAVDGHHRRLHQRSRPRPAGGARAQRAARRRRVRPRPVHRDHGDHAGPGHDRRQRAPDGAGPRAGRGHRRAPRQLLLGGAWLSPRAASTCPATTRGRRSRRGRPLRRLARRPGPERRRLDLHALVGATTRHLPTEFTYDVLNPLQDLDRRVARGSSPARRSWRSR